MWTFSPHTHGPIRTSKTRENFEESSHTTQLRLQCYKNCPSSAIDDRQGRRLVWSGEKIAHFSTANTLSSTRSFRWEGSWQQRLFRWEGSRQHDRTPTKIASTLENFPATVITPSAWPDWNRFQFLRSWHDPAEIWTTPNYDLPDMKRAL